jgi:hypothetical protein
MRQDEECLGFRMIPYLCQYGIAIISDLFLLYTYTGEIAFRRQRMADSRQQQTADSRQQTADSR